MLTDQLSQPSILKLATLRLKTIVADIREHQPLNLSLPTDGDVQGFIVLLRPALPSIE
jgi:hypothetical protein